MTKNFKLSEFSCKCGCEMPADVSANVKVLAEQLQKVRDIVGVSMKIHSGYRCVSHNKKVGGVSKSQHLTGKAADFVIKNADSKKTFNLMDILMDFNAIAMGGLGKYNSFTHYDIRGNKARWGI